MVGRERIIRVGIDVDDILLQFMGDHDVKGSFLRYLNDNHSHFLRRHGINHGRRLTSGMITHYGLQKVIGCTPDEERSLVNSFYLSDSFMDIEPVEGAVEGVRALADAGAEIYIITSRPDSIRGLTHHQLRHFPRCFTDIICASGQVVSDGGTRSKGEIGKELGLDCHFEDGLHHAMSCVEHGVVPVVKKYPWNPGLDEKKGFYFDTWNQGVDYVFERFSRSSA